MPTLTGSSPANPNALTEALENAAKEVGRQLQADRQYPDLSSQLRVSSQSKSFSSIISN